MEQAAELGIFGALKKMTEVFSGWLPILVLVSLTAGVWLYFLLVSRHEPQHRGFMESLRSFLRFEVLFWPLVGRVLYLSITVFLVLSGLITIFFVNFFGGLVGTALLLVLVRILFEMSMMLFGIHDRLMQIAPGAVKGITNANGKVPAANASGPKGGASPTSKAVGLLPPAAPGRRGAAQKNRSVDSLFDEEADPPISTWKSYAAKGPAGKGGGDDRMPPESTVPPVSRKSAETADPLPQKALVDPEPETSVDMPFFSDKRVDKGEDPVLK